MTPTNYAYSLSPTSQFYYCGLPLRLDSYSRCQFSCVYCFAIARGGYRGPQRFSIADVSSLRRRFEYLKMNPPRSVIDELLVTRQPIHFGGMSDPFPPVESELKVTLELLKVLAENQYPTVISTKNNLFERDEYVSVLKKGNFILQVSMSSPDDSLLARIDLGAPGPTVLLKALKTMQKEKIPTACRIQPLLPTREKDAFELIDACSTVGVKHIAVEHLKLPIEKSSVGISRLSNALGINIREIFFSKSAQRIGREWILPAKERLERILTFAQYTHKKGLSFGAADNDLLLLSDGECCCSGYDLLSGSKVFFRYTYTEAARRGLKENTVSIGSLEGIWCPERSMGKYINSESRLPSSNDKGQGLKEYIKNNWNGSRNGNAPSALYGVVSTGHVDDKGFNIYKFTDEMRRLLNHH